MRYLVQAKFSVSKACKAGCFSQSIEDTLTELRKFLFQIRIIQYHILGQSKIARQLFFSLLRIPRENRFPTSQCEIGVGCRPNYFTPAFGGPTFMHVLS